MTSSCVEAVDNLINGLKPTPRNESDKDTTSSPAPPTNSTSSIVQSLQQQVTLTLRKEGSVRIIKPNVACEGVVTNDPSMGIGIVILKDTDDVDDVVTTSASMTTGGLTPVSQVTNLPIGTTVTQGQRSLVSSTAAPGTVEDLQFTNDTVIVINNLDEVTEEATGTLYVPPDFIRQTSDNG